MAPSRSPIELAKIRSVMIGLCNAMSLLFLERTSNPIKARAYPKDWKTHERAEYVSVSQVLFNKRFEKWNRPIWIEFVLSHPEEKISSEVRNDVIFKRA